MKRLLLIACVATLATACSDSDGLGPNGLAPSFQGTAYVDETPVHAFHGNQGGFGFSPDPMFPSLNHLPEGVPSAWHVSSVGRMQGSDSWIHLLLQGAGGEVPPPPGTYPIALVDDWTNPENFGLFHGFFEIRPGPPGAGIGSPAAEAYEPVEGTLVVTRIYPDPEREHIRYWIEGYANFYAEAQEGYDEIPERIRVEATFRTKYQVSLLNWNPDN